MSKILMLLFASLFICDYSLAANGSKDSIPIFISTTTTEVSGLVPKLLELYRKQDHDKNRIKNIVLPSGQAIIAAANKQGDLLISHNISLENKHLSNDIKKNVKNLFYSYFVVIGDKSKKLLQINNVQDLFSGIYNNKLLFVSRDDNSGTYQKEQQIWYMLNLEPEFFDKNWYYQIGSSMSQTLAFTFEKDAITIADYPSYLAFRSKRQASDLLFAKKQSLLKNFYRIYLINKENTLAKKLYNWILSKESLAFIKSYRLGSDEQIYFTAY